MPDGPLVYSVDYYPYRIRRFMGDSATPGDAVPPSFARHLRLTAFIRLVLHTRRTPDEVANMEWREIDIEAHVWNIAKDKLQGKSPSVVLSRDAMGVLWTLMAYTDGKGFVFSNDDIGRIVSSALAYREERRARLEVVGGLDFKKDGE